MIIIKKYTIFQNLEAVHQKSSLPRPFQFWTSEGFGRVKFEVTTSKFWKIVYFLKMKKWYYYHFFINLSKNAWSKKDWFQFAKLGLLPYKIGYFVHILYRCRPKAIQNRLAQEPHVDGCYRFFWKFHKFIDNFYAN